MLRDGFLKLENAEELRGKLNDAVVLTKFEKYKDNFGINLFPQDFQWLVPIVETSLDKRLTEYLTKNSPNGTRYISLDIIEHLKEATELINKCNDRRNTIFELEAKAIFSALEYFQFLEVLDSEIMLGEINLKAIYQQSGLQESENKYKEAFNKRTISTLEILRTKLSLHNEKGNSLNYGERVSYLRDLYCDDVRTIYERLIAIKRVLKHSFGQETESLPNFEDVTSKLDLIVWWMRNTVRQFESDAEYEYFFEKTISLNNFSLSGKPIPKDPFGDYHVDGTKVLLPDFKSQQLLALITNGKLEFTLTDDDFRLPNDPIGRKLHFRVISAAVNIVEDYKHEPQSRPSRNTRLYHCEITPPEQKLQLELSEIFDVSLNEQEEAKKESENFLKRGEKGETLSRIMKKKGELKGIDPITGRLIFENDNPKFEQFTFPNRFIVGDIKPVQDTSILDEQVFQSPKSIRNINPIGNWHIYLQNSTLGNMQRFFGLSQVMDLSLTFRVGVRHK